MMKKFLRLMLALTLMLPFGAATVQANDQLAVDQQEKENLQKLELYQMMDRNLREIGLSFEMLSKTQIDFSNTSYPSPVPEPTIRARAAVDDPNYEETKRYLSVNQYAQKRYGSNPTEEQKMKMYLLYYFDVEDSDKATGKVGPNLRRDYYLPDYMGENDENVYNAFIRTTYGGKTLERAKTTAELVKSGSGLEKISIKKLINNYRSIKTWVEEAKKSRKAWLFRKKADTYLKNDILRNVKMVDGFMRYWDEAVSKTPGERVDEKTKDTIKEFVIGAAFSVCLGTPIGIVAVVTQYTVSNLALTYLSLYDRAAINALAYTRSTRITLRQYASWW
ncbi:MAG: hypothetical protein L0F95_00985 [Lactococcus sp.]|uniref:Uncharacterized protein n=1 Tax=Pseudolactococcus piscium MKFS47 TaxID=297352 RepID=A0A0D6DXS6_9LACT|nr:MULTISPECIES: hypothetical protein [Lactococcus]MDN5403450.1 hypothetical protein [Lactococcus sp.]MDN5409097.1 hypothetical protein [Lactococcus sp.]MDN5410967.1 hypothetical protein [Lactococcus sp.]MDN5435688.1 hypothetical protein [Lactococcus sp.]MDN5461015.1 hypothetical protein [Lactococcus sp.]